MMRQCIMLLSLLVLMACGNSNSSRLELLDSKDIHLVEKEMELSGTSKDFFEKVIEFHLDYDGDVSPVRVVATFYRNSDCALDVLPMTSSRKTNLPVPSYDEQIAMLYRVINICKEKYGVSQFIHILISLDCMGDLSAEVVEKRDRFLAAGKDDDNAYRMAIEDSRLVSDLKLLFPKDNISSCLDIPLNSQRMYAEFRLERKGFWSRVFA